ncbi:MAG: rhomboid family intramembrane serine protease [Acidobacteriia bacterium]|nr:rhomboid family intramembrane serine protease [Terriglobia bacterium]
MSRINITTCRNCGAEFSPPILGATSDLCPQCRQEQLPPPRQPAPQLQRPPLSVLVQQFPVTSAIIALNVLVFVVMVAKGVSPAEPTRDQLLRWGADFGPMTLSGQPWRLLASCFVHAGLLHILFNMWCLWSLGMFVERYLDRATFAAAYLLAGIGGAVASVWWHPLVVGVGASGAIFGAAGMLVTILRSGQLALPAEYLKRHSKSIVAFIGYNLFFGFISPHIDNSAHLGGLATGLLLGALLPIAGSEEGTGKKIGTFGLAVVLLFTGFTYAKRVNAAPMAWADGVQAMQAKQYDKAVAAFKDAISHDPKFAQAYLDLGYVYLVQEKYADAVPVLQTATQLAPDVAGGFTNLGYAYVRLDRPKEAEAPLLRAIQIDPKDADAWENLAMAYAAEGKADPARKAAQTALRLDPRMKEAQQVLDNLRAHEPPADSKPPTVRKPKK